MSIKLKIEPYCENCTMFDPATIEDGRTTPVAGGSQSDRNILVYCTNAKKCENISRYIINQLIKEQNAHNK